MIVAWKKRKKKLKIKKKENLFKSISDQVYVIFWAADMSWILERINFELKYDKTSLILHVHLSPPAIIKAAPSVAKLLFFNNNHINLWICVGFVLDLWTLLPIIFGTVGFEPTTLDF